MGLFRKPPTPKELEQQRQYEEAKLRLMKLHKESNLLFYIDEIQLIDTEASPTQLLIGEAAKGSFTIGTELSIYDCTGLCVGHMTIQALEEREEKLSIFEKGIRTYCTPSEYWDGYQPGQFLADLPAAKPIIS